MGYYTRVFCKSHKTPTVAKLLDAINTLGYTVNSNLNQKEIEREDWIDFELYYKSDKLPILVEINRVGNSEGLAEEEISEFKDKIGKPGFFELSKKTVINQLNNTRYIICNQLPTSDMEHEGYNVNGVLMKIVAEKFDGLVQCDGEGFYKEEKLILKE